jgi:hypothetical protein
MASGLLPLFLNIGDTSPIFSTSGISPSKNILFKICVRTVIIFSPACNICSIVKLLLMDAIAVGP